MNPERFKQLVNFAPEDFVAGNSSTSPDNIVADDGGGNVIGNPKKNPEAVARTRTRQFARISEVFGQEGESVPDTLRRLFVAESGSVRQVIKRAHLYRETVNSILDELKIPRKIKGSVAYEEWRKDKLREFWQDPVNKEKTIAKIHTTASDALRSSGIKKYYEQNPDAGEAVRKRNKAIKVAKRVALCKELFGTCDLKIVLESLTSYGLDRVQIAREFGVESITVRNWAKELGVELKNSVPRRPEKLLQKSEYRRDLVAWAKEKGLFQSLTERQRQVLDLLYGEKNTRPTLRELCEKLRISKQRSYQLSQAAFGRLDRLVHGERVGSGRKPFQLPFEKMGDNPSETLASWYEDKGLSTLDIGKNLGCSEVLAWKLLRAIGVEMRRVGSKKGAAFEDNDLAMLREMPDEIAQVSAGELNFGMANSIMLRNDLMSLSIGELSTMSDDELMSLKGFGKGKVNSVRFAIAKFVREQSK